MDWVRRAVDRSPTVRRSRERSIEQAAVVVDAARRLVVSGSGSFTTQELIKEAGIALQTFYGYFASKDELILAAIEEWVSEGAERMIMRVEGLDHPLQRLRVYVTSSIEALVDDEARTVARFITAEHYRLHQVFPEELARSTQLYTDLFHEEIVAASAAGLIPEGDARSDAWMIMQLSMAVFHHFVFATSDEPIEAVCERLWRFCARSLHVERDHA